MALTRTQSPTDVYVKRAKDDVPGFVHSYNYDLLDEEDRMVPGLVFAALARFLVSEQKRCMSGADSAAISPALKLIEEMAGSDDDDVQNIVVTEVFETWDDSPVADALRSRLHSKSRSLHRRWLGA